MKFRVKQSHIKNGKRNTLSLCPIALCIREQFPKADSVNVTNAKIRIDDLQINTPENVKNFIANFDTGQPVKSIKFTIKGL